jgi:hypothetical protein
VSGGAAAAAATGHRNGYRHPMTLKTRWRRRKIATRFLKK